MKVSGSDVVLKSGVFPEPVQNSDRISSMCFAAGSKLLFVDEECRALFDLVLEHRTVMLWGMGDCSEFVLVEQREGGGCYALFNPEGSPLRVVDLSDTVVSVSRHRKAPRADLARISRRVVSQGLHAGYSRVFLLKGGAGFYFGNSDPVAAQAAG